MKTGIVLSALAWFLLTASVQANPPIIIESGKVHRCEPIPLVPDPTACEMATTFAEHVTASPSEPGFNRFRALTEKYAKDECGPKASNSPIADAPVNDDFCNQAKAHLKEMKQYYSDARKAHDADAPPDEGMSCQKSFKRASKYKATVFSLWLTLDYASSVCNSDLDPDLSKALMDEVADL